MRALGPTGAAVVLAALLAGCGGSTKVVTVVTSTTTVSSSPVTSSQSSSSSTGLTSTQTSSSAAASTVSLTTFKSPTGNIGCMLFSGSARCDVRNRTWSPLPRPASCPNIVDFGQGVALGNSGSAQLVCAGDTTLDPSAAVLPYGTVSAADGFTCTSATSGMTCSRGGHGFFISAQSYRTF